MYSLPIAYETQTLRYLRAHAFLVEGVGGRVWSEHRRTRLKVLIGRVRTAG